jgi:serine/threonine-protein kinase RsbW
MTGADGQTRTFQARAKETAAEPTADFVAELTAGNDAISDLTAQVMAFLEQAGVDQRAAHHATLVLHELLANVADHGGVPDAKASVSIAVSPVRVTGEVLDGGKMFDPSLARDVDLSADVGARPVGGLGLLLMRRLTESLAYERVGERNRTTFSIGRTRAP